MAEVILLQDREVEMAAQTDDVGYWNGC